MTLYALIKLSVLCVRQNGMRERTLNQDSSVPIQPSFSPFSSLILSLLLSSPLFSPPQAILLKEAAIPFPSLFLDLSLSFLIPLVLLSPFLPFLSFFLHHSPLSAFLSLLTTSANKLLQYFLPFILQFFFLPSFLILPLPLSFNFFSPPIAFLLPSFPFLYPSEQTHNTPTFHHSLSSFSFHYPMLT